MHARPPVLVPPDEMMLALRLHSWSHSKHVAPLFASGRYIAAALKAVASQACRALDEGPLSTAAIHASINHPDAGELLVGALIDLAGRGVIRRCPADGRLGSPKYMYELRHPDDRPDLDSEGDDSSVALKATRVFLRRHGPATADEIASWGSLTKGAVRQALSAEPIAIEDWTDKAWLLPEDVAAWHRFSGEMDRVVLLSYRDPFVYFCRPQAILTGRDTVPVLAAARTPVAIRNVSIMHNHAIVAGGELVGGWESDPAARRVVTRVWHTDRGLGARVAAAADETCRFIRDHIGDAKISAVDPPVRRARRIAFCRA
jgi:Winged helix DNA-binding domain